MGIDTSRLVDLIDLLIMWTRSGGPSSRRDCRVSLRLSIDDPSSSSIILSRAHVRLKETSATPLRCAIRWAAPCMGSSDRSVDLLWKSRRNHRCSQMTESLRIA